jgi:hypothetical protein
LAVEALSVISSLARHIWSFHSFMNGIYQEPLERVLQYMGLSMDIDQVVNRSIDGDTKRRALLPGNVLEANHWHEEYTRAASRAARATELAQKLAELTRELQETEEKEP